MVSGPLSTCTILHSICPLLLHQGCRQAGEVNLVYQWLMHGHLNSVHAYLLWNAAWLPQVHESQSKRPT